MTSRAYLSPHSALLLDKLPQGVYAGLLRAAELAAALLQILHKTQQPP